MVAAHGRSNATEGNTGVMLGAWDLYGGPVSQPLAYHDINLHLLAGNQDGDIAVISHQTGRARADGSAQGLTPFETARRYHFLTCRIEP